MLPKELDRGLGGLGPRLFVEDFLDERDLRYYRLESRSYQKHDQHSTRRNGCVSRGILFLTADGVAACGVRLNSLKHLWSPRVNADMTVELDLELFRESPKPVSYGCVLFPGSGADFLVSRRNHRARDFHRHLNLGIRVARDSTKVC